MAEEAPPPKRIKEMQTYSTVSQRIMASMGYKPGEGLGRSGEGITAPISEDIHKGRRGLGYILDGLEKEDVHWELEEISCHQKGDWLPPCPLPLLLPSDLLQWIQLGKRKDTIENETIFCDESVLKSLLNLKSVFDNLSDKEFLDARQRSNPFETIKGAIFQNRAAMKMANIDTAFDFMFTHPKKPNGSDLLGPTDVLYFADICAGPGGFSEYVLWRKQWEAKGFGLTLKDPDSGSDFKLDAFLAAPCETFDVHYGVGGYDGDGDITNPDNLIAFREYVLEQTEGKGVHFVMGDGGVSVEGQENIQEILTKQLVLGQYICALSILREGGHFVCKVFDMFTPFSVGLFYLLYRCFKQVCIFKPVTSRPANSERYIVCKGLTSGGTVVHDYLFYVNQELHRIKSEGLDVLEVASPSLLQDEPFYSYVTASINKFGVNQALHLEKIRHFVKNMNLFDTRQAEIRKKCLKLWKVPDTPRPQPYAGATALHLFTEFWKQLKSTPLSSDGPADLSLLSSDNFTAVKEEELEFLKDIHSWKWYWACGKRLMLVGLGRNMVHAWDMKSNKPVFTQGRFSGLELPKRTILEVELVEELQGEGSGQKKRIMLYIVDVISIYGKLYGKYSLKERQLYAEKLCKVVNKPCRRSVLLKCKQYHRATELQRLCERLSLRQNKGVPFEAPVYPVNDMAFIAPVGVIFVKAIKGPWQLHLSKSGRFYYFNDRTGESSFECPPTSVASFLSVLSTRHFWCWNRQIFHELCCDSLEESDTSELTPSRLYTAIGQFKKPASTESQ